MLLFWSALIVDGRVVRLGRWERWCVGRWEVHGFIQGWELLSEFKISSFCF